MSWTALGFKNFSEAFESYWPTYPKQWIQRNQLLNLIRQEIEHVSIDAAIKGLREIKVNETCNRVPTIPRIKEAVFASKAHFPGADVVPQGGITWQQFVKTHDWEAHLGRLMAHGKSTTWIERNLPRWRAGIPLSKTVEFSEPRKMREPGED